MESQGQLSTSTFYKGVPRTVTPEDPGSRRQLYTGPNPESQFVRVEEDKHQQSRVPSMPSLASPGDESDDSFASVQSLPVQLQPDREHVGFPLAVPSSDTSDSDFWVPERPEQPFLEVPADWHLQPLPNRNNLGQIIDSGQGSGSDSVEVINNPGQGSDSLNSGSDDPPLPNFAGRLALQRWLRGQPREQLPPSSREGSSSSPELYRPLPSSSAIDPYYEIPDQIHLAPISVNSPVRPTPAPRRTLTNSNIVRARFDAAQQSLREFEVIRPTPQTREGVVDNIIRVLSSFDPEQRKAIAAIFAASTLSSITGVALGIANMAIASVGRQNQADTEEERLAIMDQ